MRSNKNLAIVSALFLAIIGLNSCHSGSFTSESKKLNTFLDRAFDRKLDRHPMFAAYADIVSRRASNDPNASHMFGSAPMR